MFPLKKNKVGDANLSKVMEIKPRAGTSFNVSEGLMAAI